MFVYKVIGKLIGCYALCSCVWCSEIINRNRCSSVNIVNKLWGGGAGGDCQQGKESFHLPSCPEVSHSAFYPLDPFFRVKRPKCYVYHSPLSKIDVRSAWSYIPTCNMSAWCGA